MTLGKRTLLVIFPVILIIQLVASTTAYLTQRASLLGLEQARLEQQLSVLTSAYLDYEAFNRSVLYSIMDSEALLLFHDSEVADMARLMRRQDYLEMEMLLDLSSLLISACLSGIAEQIEVVFSQGHPQVLGQHASIDELIRLNSARWKKTLAVEISYSLEGHDIHFDLLLLFTEDSVELLTRKLAHLMD